MGGIASDRGRLVPAERLLQRALGILENTFEPPHPEIAGVLNSLAEVYRSRGRLALAEALYNRACDPQRPRWAKTIRMWAAFCTTSPCCDEERSESQAAAALMARVAGDRRLPSGPAA